MHKRPEEMMNMLLNLRNMLTARELFTPPYLLHKAFRHSLRFTFTLPVPCSLAAVGQDGLYPYAL